jgi:DNA-binding SARP family transcriptional activator
VPAPPVRALPALRLVCLGAPTAWLAGRPAPAEVLWRKNLALLIYLALSPENRRTRSHLTGLLWPDRDEAHARHSLNEAVRRLRVALGADRLTSVGEEIRLSPQDIELDVRELEAASAGTAALPDELSGEFLESFSLDDAPGFEEWAAAARSRYRALQITSLVAFGERRLATNDPVAARGVALRALALDPYAEPTARLGMQAAALADDAAGALKIFRDLAARLEEIGERPSARLRALADRIRSGTWRPAAGPAQQGPRFVGQRVAWAAARRVVEHAASRRASVLLVTGDPGAGKSRFLAECAARSALDGATTVLHRAVPEDRAVPWSALRGVLRAGLQDAPGLVGAATDALAVLGAVAPLPARVQPREPRDRGEVTDALAAVLASVSEERPLAVGLDDADTADSASLGALVAALERVSSGAVLLMLSAGADESEWSPELLDALAGAERTLPVERARLEPLSEADLLELIPQLAPWCTDTADRQRLARRLRVDTAGNPLIALALLHDLAEFAALREGAARWPAANTTLEATLPIAVPQLVRFAILARVARLSPAARTILGASSIGDQRLDLGLVALLANAPSEQVEEHLTELERQHLIRYDGTAYTFATPLVSLVARRELLTAGHAARLRAKAIAHLAAAAGHASRVLRVELLCRSKPDRGSADEAVEAARAALASGERRLAARALRAAAHAVAEAADADRAAIEAARNELLGAVSPARAAGAEPLT